MKRNDRVELVVFEIWPGSCLLPPVQPDGREFRAEEVERVDWWLLQRLPPPQCSGLVEEASVAVEIFLDLL